MGPGPLDVSNIPSIPLLIFIMILTTFMTVGTVWIIIPYCIAMVIKLINKIKRIIE